MALKNIRALILPSFATGLLIVLAACSSIIKSPITARIADGVDMPLLRATTDMSLTQKVTATYNNETHVFIMQVETQSGKTTIAGLTPTGTRLFSLSFDGEALESWKSPLFSAPFDASYVLADYQLTAFDAQTLQHVLPKNVVMDEKVITQTGEWKTVDRKIRRDSGKTLITINYINPNNILHNKTRYCHLERNYCLDIETLSP